jgi:hypothetical protein
MPGVEFYRSHADRCRMLAERHAEQHWAAGLVRLAAEYEAKATQVESCSHEYAGDFSALARGASAET